MTVCLLTDVPKTVSSKAEAEAGVRESTAVASAPPSEVVASARK